MGIRTLETDYLVVGCGAAGMAFVDALIDACDADVVMVDRRHAPGGHWNDAYPFVRLHQPSSIYGVNSMPLGNDSIDRDGPNAGLYERATGSEICGYYDRVMRERLLASGQVHHFPMCEYLGEGRFVSRLSGDEHEVKVRRRLVDATYLEPSIPATFEPPFQVAPEARCVPVGELPRLSERADGFTLIGAGKTAADACVWLLEAGVAPEDIRWIKPREPWLINRRFFQSGELVGSSFEGVSLIMEAAAQADSVEDCCARLEDSEWMLRADRDIVPTMLKGATTTPAEIEELQRVEDVVRLGHVRRIEGDSVVLEDGSVPTSPAHLHVHCAAPGLNQAPAIPIFSDDRITVQTVRGAVLPFSSALAAFVEAMRGDIADKNRLCPSIRQYDEPADLLRGVLVETAAAGEWSTEPDIQEWLERSRLNWLRGLDRHLDEPHVQEAQRRFSENVGPALANLERLLTPAEAAPAAP